MRTASVSEAKARLSALLDIVRGGDSVTITDRGRPVARLVPALDIGEDDARMQRLVRRGLLQPPRRKLDVKAFLKEPPIDLGGGVVDLLLEERRTGR